MTRKQEISGRVAAELVTHLGRIIYGDGFVQGFTSAQWMALRYFSRANRFSRTPSAFAEFHGTTRGAASQTIKSLVAQGWLTRTPLQADGRSARLDLTEKTRAILGGDPFEALVQAASALPRSTRGQLANALERMLGHVALARGKRPFGMCTSCEHLDCDVRHMGGRPPYECLFVGEPLEPEELEQICINYESGKTAARKRTFSGAAPG